MSLQHAYVVYASELANGSPDHHVELSMLPSGERAARATKFPRIGRSASDGEELAALYDGTLELDDMDSDSRWLEQRSVLFPRIGKRAFHNSMWANSYSNPYRMLDSQGRYHISGYDYHIHPNQAQFVGGVRGKRALHKA